jgi:hypothetical protein
MPPPLPSPGSPLEYQTPPHTHAPPRPIVDAPLLITGIAFAVVVTILTLSLSLRLEAIFRDFGTKLPVVTLSVLQFCRICRGGALPLVWAAMLAPAFLVPLLRPWPPADPRRRYSRLARMIATLLFGLLTAWIALGLFIPYVGIIDAVTVGSPKK